MVLMINQYTMFVPTTQAAISRVGAETVLLHLENGTYYGLDAEGTFVWDLLRDGSNLAEICAVLHKE